MKGLSIGELARRAGLQASAIRYYESAGLMPAPERRGGRRVYDESALRWLALIALARSAGFRIGEVRSLIHGFSKRTAASKRWRALASDKLVEVRDQIRQARAMERVLVNLLDCECPTLEDCGAALTRHAASAADRE